MNTKNGETMCEIISEEKLKAILDEVSSQEIAAYWFDENHQYQNRDNWIYGILSQYNEYRKG